MLGGNAQSSFSTYQKRQLQVTNYIPTLFSQTTPRKPVAALLLFSWEAFRCTTLLNSTSPDLHGYDPFAAHIRATTLVSFVFLYSGTDFEQNVSPIITNFFNLGLIVIFQTYLHKPCLLLCTALICAALGLCTV